MSTKFLEDICNTARAEVVGDHREVVFDSDEEMGLGVTGVVAGSLEEGGDSQSDDEERGANSEEGGSSDQPGIAEDERHEEDGVPNKRHRSMNDQPPLTRPSDYLRSRCPLCFGGKSTLAEGLVEFIICFSNFLSFCYSLGAIACIDAVFTQKNDKQNFRDPPRTHPKSVFIPEADTKAWEDFVMKVRPRKPSKPSPDIDDSYEGTLKVPNSVLDGCEQSFTAADET